MAANDITESGGVQWLKAGCPDVAWPEEPRSRTVEKQMHEVNSCIRVLNELGMAAMHGIVSNDNNNTLTAIANCQYRLCFGSWKKRAQYANEMQLYRRFFLFGPEQEPTRNVWQWAKERGAEGVVLYNAAVAWRSFSVLEARRNAGLAPLPSDDATPHPDHVLADERATEIAAQEQNALKRRREVLKQLRAKAEDETPCLTLPKALAVLMSAHVESEIASREIIGQIPLRRRPPPHVSLESLGWDPERGDFGCFHERSLA